MEQQSLQSTITEAESGMLSLAGLSPVRFSTAGLLPQSPRVVSTVKILEETTSPSHFHTIKRCPLPEMLAIRTSAEMVPAPSYSERMAGERGAPALHGLPPVYPTSSSPILTGRRLATPQRPFFNLPFPPIGFPSVGMSRFPCIWSPFPPNLGKNMGREFQFSNAGNAGSMSLGVLDRSLAEDSIQNYPDNAAKLATEKCGNNPGSVLGSSNLSNIQIISSDKNVSKATEAQGRDTKLSGTHANSDEKEEQQVKNDVSHFEEELNQSNLPSNITGENITRDESSFSGDDMLDSSSVFDEDLEPLDLSKRFTPPVEGLASGGQLATREESKDEEEENRGKLFMNFGMNRTSYVQRSKRGQLKFAKIPRSQNIKLPSRRKLFEQKLLFESKTGLSQVPLDHSAINKRHPSDAVRKKRSNTEGSNSSEKVHFSYNREAKAKNMKRSSGISSFCRRCRTDFRATSMVRCPVCAANSAIQNSSTTTNSTIASVATLPDQVSLCRRGGSITVVTNCVIKCHTLMGPMEGELIDLRDITQEMDVSYLWVNSGVISEDTVLLSTIDEAKSNWLRYVKTGKDSSNYNLALVRQNENIFFITVQKVNIGQELVLRPFDPLLVHLNANRENKCSICELTCDSQMHLAKHMFFFHPNQEENVSSGTEASDPTIKQPIDKDSTSENHEISIDGEAQESLANQGESHILRWFCYICMSHFKSKAGYRAHMSIVHKHHSPNHVMLNHSFQCQDCGATFRSPWTLHRHTKTHALKAAGSKTLSCPQCGREFWRKQSYRRHVQAHQAHELQLAPTCDYCGRKFYSSSNLKVHMLTHSGVKPFTCAVPMCTSGFTTKQSLQFHYIKRHGFFYETMPQIERSVPFTFEDYGGSKTEIKTEVDYNIKQETETGDDEGYKTKDDLTPLPSTPEEKGESCQTQIMTSLTADLACQNESGIHDISSDRTS